MLAKIFGFYSVQMRTLNDKKQVFNMDVLVMEQLFYGQSISKVRVWATFILCMERLTMLPRLLTLKGFLTDRSRKKNGTSRIPRYGMVIGKKVGSLHVNYSMCKTDPFFLSVAYRMGYFTFEQSRAWVDSAIRRDTEFLASSNIMDYSLLVGIDEAKKELSVGIVGKRGKKAH